MVTANGKTTDEARIRDVIDEWANAIRTKDAAGVIAHETADLVQFTLAPPLQYGPSDAEGLEAWFATWQGPIGYEFRDLAITVGGDVAFCRSLNRMTGTKTDGEKNELWFRLTLGFRKEGDTWKIAHVHESVPFSMDGSDRASVDLKP